MATPRRTAALVGGTKRRSSKTQMAGLRARTGPTRAIKTSLGLGKATPSARAMERASSRASFKRGPETAVAATPSKVRAKPGTTTYRKRVGPSNAVKATPAKTRAKAGTQTYRAKAKPAPQVPGKNPLAEIGEWLDSVIPTRKWKHPVVGKPLRDVNVPMIVKDALNKKPGK